jgi:hypothetical protein
MSMTRIRQSALVAVTLMALVAAAGCSSAAGQGGDDTALQADRASGAGTEGQAPGSPGAAPEGGGPGAPGAPEAPGPGGPDENARAPGSPITIPAFTQIGGQPVEKVRKEIEAAIREACTPQHDLCVTTVVEAVADPGERPDAHACFGGTEPPTAPSPTAPSPTDPTDPAEIRFELDRGSVLTILSVLPDCGDDEYESSSSSTESSETTQSSSDSTETSESSQAPPSSDTETSETVQSDAGPPPSTS